MYLGYRRFVPRVEDICTKGRVQSVSNIQIFKYIREYSPQIRFIIVFAVKYFTNYIYICQRFRFRKIFVFVFVQKKLYSLHSGFNPGMVTHIRLG